MNTLFHLPHSPLRRLLLGLLCTLLLSGCGMFRPQDHYTESSAPSSKVVRTAYTQMGAKYRLGGASPQKGFDCSGLIWWAYNQNGMDVPRITTDQARAGRAVPANQARPGDIVVFRTGTSPRGLHTGIYAGEGSFIHSPSKGQRVRMESLAIPYWRDKLVSVRRVGR